MNEKYKIKYLKYKNKYIILKNQIAGMGELPDLHHNYCSICRELINSNDPIRRCFTNDHMFHTECINQWLTKRNTINLHGGKIPQINDIDTTSPVELMNKIGPLYFNYDKNPIRDISNNYYKYDFNYNPDSIQFLIDSDLNLNPILGNNSELLSNEIPLIDDKYRVIKVNGREIPYYYGLFHYHTKIFANIKFLFQYVSVVESKNDPTKKDIIIIKQEKDIIKFINGLFNISNELRVLIGINQRLQNIIDKYIFIGKFYEFLEIITYEPHTINNDIDLLSIEFTNIKEEDNTTNKPNLNYLINKYDIKGLAEYYYKKNKPIQFFKKFIQDEKINNEEKIKYIRMLTKLDYIITKLKSIFVIDMVNDGNNTNKINLINLIDLYNGYGAIFINETANNSKDIIISNNIDTINKINNKVSDGNKLLNNLIIELLDLKNILDKIINWPISNKLPVNDLDMILLLSYFDLRVNSTQIKQGSNLNALPINKNNSLNNLFGNERSTIPKDEYNRSINRYIKNTEDFLKNLDGPEFITSTPRVDIPADDNVKNDIKYAVCVENTILQLVKVLFWDYNSNKYNLNKINLSPNNFLRKFMEKFINDGGIQTDNIIREFVKPTINRPNIIYIKPNDDNTKWYELDAISENVIKILLHYLKTDKNEILTNSNIFNDNFDQNLEDLTNILSNNNYRLDISKSTINEKLTILNLYRIGDGELLITVRLMKGAHGEIEKKNKYKLDNLYIDRPIRYLYEDLMDEKKYVTYHDGSFIEYGMIDLYNFFNNDEIESKYLSSNDNIYWLNFYNIKFFIKNFKQNITKFLHQKHFTDLSLKQLQSKILGEIDNSDSENSSENNLSRKNRNIIQRKYNQKEEIIKDHCNIFTTKIINIIFDILITKYDKDKIINTEPGFVANFLDIIYNNEGNTAEKDFSKMKLCHEFEQNSPNIYTFNYQYQDDNDVYYIINCNLIQYYIIEKLYEKLGIEILKSLVKKDKTYLYNYKTNDVQPLNLLLFKILYKISEDNVEQYLKIINELIDPDNFVLYKYQDDSLDTKKFKLPIYRSLDYYYRLSINIYKNKENNEIYQIHFFNNLIKIFIDKEKYILDIDIIKTPIKWYNDYLINDYEQNKYTIIDNINIFFDPFSLIQTKKNILYNNGRSSLLADLLFKIMDNYSEDINLNSIISYIIENKLLFDSEVDGNQSVFNIINNNGYSLLSKYLRIIRDNEFKYIFKYFYNKELLIVQPTPLCEYIKNNELSKNYFYNHKIIALLSKNYNDQNPLLIKDNYVSSAYPIELLLQILIDYEQENFSNALNFLNSDDFYRIMHLMMYNYEESVIDKILTLLNKIYDKFELLNRENVNQENKKRIFQLIKNFNYKEKYLKYKTKYLNLQLLLGGGVKSAKDYFNNQILKDYNRILNIFRSDEMLIDIIDLQQLPDENRIDSIKQQYKNINDQRIQINQIDIFTSIFDLIKNEVNDNFIQKLVEIYLSGNLGEPNSIENKESFIKNMQLNILLNNNLDEQGNKQGMNITNIDSFRTLKNFIETKEEIIKSINERKKQKEEERVYEKTLLEGKGGYNVDILLDKPNVKVYHPLTELGAKYYGRRTKWCTAARNNNMFNHYNSIGPMYIIEVYKDNSKKVVKYQIHYRAGQYMNSEDKEQDLENIINEINDQDFNNILGNILKKEIISEINTVIKNISNNKLIFNENQRLFKIQFRLINGILPSILKSDYEINKLLNDLFDKLVNLHTLKFDSEFNQPLDNYLDKLVNLQTLQFGYDFNQPLGNSLDKLVNLQTLKFGSAFNKLLGNSLDKLVNLQTLQFGYNFKQPLGNSLDKLINLQTLQFGYNFNQPLGNSLDKLINLQTLQFGYDFNQPLGNSLDKLINLQTLQFGYNFNQPLGNSLDKLVNLQTLKFSYAFNKPLCNSLDKLVNLEILQFGFKFNKPLGNSLDKLINLKTLEFTTHFNQSLGNSLDKLINLEILQFGYNFNQPLGNSLDKLVKLQTLHLGYSFSEPIGNSLDKLVNLQTIKINYDYPDKSFLQNKFPNITYETYFYSNILDSDLDSDLEW